MAAEPPAQHVIHISIDGLHPGLLQEEIDAGRAPSFTRLQDEGAWTANARTDFTRTNTIPNHTSMLTGRPVEQADGMPPTRHHGYLGNASPARGATLHNAGNPSVDYIASVFDVAHDAGLATALYANKDKFVIYDQSYSDSAGAEHARGRGKIDVYYFQDDGEPEYSAGMHERFLADMAARRFHYVMVHYGETDHVGHAHGWGSPNWRRALARVDRYLADILQLTETSPQLADRTVLIVTTDHGGVGDDHNDPPHPENYTIPVFVWGAGVGRGDLYAMNRDTRADPGDSRPDYTAEVQPIRNGDTGNLALSLLGLDPIPGSVINAAQDLRVSLPDDHNGDGVIDAADYTTWRDRLGTADE